MTTMFHQGNAIDVFRCYISAYARETATRMRVVKTAYLSSDALSANLSCIFRLLFAYMLPLHRSGSQPSNLLAWWLLRARHAASHQPGGCSSRGARRARGGASNHTRTGPLGPPSYSRPYRPSNRAYRLYNHGRFHPSIKLRTKYPYDHLPM